MMINTEEDLSWDKEMGAPRKQEKPCFIAEISCYNSLPSLIDDNFELIKIDDWGYDFYQKIKYLPALNTVVMFYLIKHPKLIPDEWKEKSISFWGTVWHLKLKKYPPKNSENFIPTIGFNGKTWNYILRKIDGNFGENDYAAIWKNLSNPSKT